MLQRFEQAERIKRGLQIAPAPERIENTLARFVASCLGEAACRGFLRRLRRSCGAVFFQSCTVCHKFSSMNLLFCHRSQRVACRRVGGFAHCCFWMRLGGANCRVFAIGRFSAVVAQHTAPLQRAHQRFELASHFFRRRARCEGDGCADMDGDFADAGQATVLALHLPDAV